MASRTGLTTIKKTACFMAAFMTGALPAIKRAYPNNTDLHTAIEVAIAACTALCTLADEALPLGD